MQLIDKLSSKLLAAVFSVAFSAVMIAGTVGPAHTTLVSGMVA